MKTVIVVEDDPAVQDAISMVFSRAGFKVITYSNGKALLENETIIPHLYIVDKQLPGVDGLDICRYLKTKDATRRLPIIILSATPHVEKLAKDADADGFLEKPFQNATLLNLAVELMKNRL